MEKIPLSMIIAVLALFVAGAVGQAGTITVEISGIQQVTGTMTISLFNNPDAFPDHGANYRAASIAVESKKVTYTFSDIPGGDYAIAVYHDANGNNEFDKNMLGIPQESYAFSNNAGAPFGPPGFKKAKFRLIDHYNANILLK